MPPGLVLALTCSAALAALGQIFLKLGASGSGSLLALVNPWVGFGLCAYAAGVLIWLYALGRAPLYVVYPFTLLTFVLVGVASVVLFDERPSVVAMAGWATIVLGLALVYVGGSA
jgi:undecaprenyl phosphate-alpha-L-ara4N flippase subunit ArnE